MRNRWKRVAVWLLVAGVALVALILLLARPANEPHYEGRPLSYWVVFNWPPTNLPLQLKRERAIRAMGTNAFPYLVKWATYTPRQWQATLGNLALKAGVSKAYYRRLPYVKKEHRAEAALCTLADLRRPAWPALEDLARVAATSHKTNTITRARHCIFFIIQNSQYWPTTVSDQPSAMLADAFAHTNPIVREEATNVLKKWYPLFQHDVRARYQPPP